MEDRFIYKYDTVKKERGLERLLMKTRKKERMEKEKFKLQYLHLNGGKIFSFS